MAEPTVICPQCKTEIKLTESLAAPLLDSIRRDYEQRLRKKIPTWPSARLLFERTAPLEKTKATLDQQVAQKLQQERLGSPPRSSIKPSSLSAAISTKKLKKSTCCRRS